jgi:hypothetical protein
MPNPWDDILTEVLNWLRRQNAATATPFWDRPVVLTVLGGLFAGLLTTGWQISASRREKETIYQQAVAADQIALLKEVDTIYENTGEIANGWFTRVIWIAEETNKPKTPDTEKNITQWKDESHKLEQQLSTAAPLDSALLRALVLYRCPSVKQIASQMRATWDKYLDFFQEFNQDWNQKQRLPQQDIDAAESTRKTVLDKLKTLNNQLIMSMGAEVSAAREGRSTCPP